MFIRYCFLPAGVSLELIRLGSGSGIQGGKNNFFSYDEWKQLGAIIRTWRNDASKK